VRCSTRWSPAGPTPRCSPDLAKGKLRSKIPALREALEGRFEAHHALIIGAILARLDFLDEQIARLGDAIEAELAPTRQASVRLAATITGVAERTAEVMFAEIGIDMSVFPSAGHLPARLAAVPATTNPPANADPAASARAASS
jgi:transposase